MKYYISFIAAALLLSACQKNSSCPDKLRLTASTQTPTVGQSIVLRTNNGRGNYNWTGPNNFSAVKTDGPDSLVIDNIMINGSGWYYCGASTQGRCATVVDSILIQVQYRQGAPSCSLTKNRITGSAVPTLQATSVTKRLDPTFNGMSLRAIGDYGNATYLVLFNSYKGASEPKDGIYTTKDVQAFNMFEDADRLFIQCQFSNTYFKTKPGQQVYVSHVNGKLSVSFCSLQFSGDSGNGNLFTSTFSGNMTEL